MRKVLLAAMLMGCGGEAARPAGTWQAGGQWLLLEDTGDYSMPDDHGHWTENDGSAMLFSTCANKSAWAALLDANTLAFAGREYRRTDSSGPWVSVCR